MGIQIVTSPIPHTKLSKINEIHEKGDRGGGKNICSFRKKVSVWESMSFKII